MRHISTADLSEEEELIYICNSVRDCCARMGFIIASISTISPALIRSIDFAACSKLVELLSSLNSDGHMF